MTEQQNMRISGKTIGLVAALGLSAAVPAAARDSVSITLDPGGIAFAYQDGYWDRDHQWHRWHNGRERDEYRRAYAENFHNWRHDRDRDMGWRERDEDHRAYGGGRDRDDRREFERGDRREFDRGDRHEYERDRDDHDHDR